MTAGRPQLYESLSIVTTSIPTELNNKLIALSRSKGLSKSRVVTASLSMYFKDNNIPVLPDSIIFNKESGEYVCANCNEYFESFPEVKSHLCLFGHKEETKQEEQSKEASKIIVPEVDKETKRRSNVLLYGGFGF